MSQYPAPLPPSGPATVQRPTNGLAIASLVVALVGVALLCATWIGGVAAIPGAVLGHVARGQIRVRGDSGDGVALAGIIVGWIAGALGIIAAALLAAYVVWGLGWAMSTFS